MPCAAESIPSLQTRSQDMGTARRLFRVCSISGKNVKLQEQSPLSLTFDSGEVQFDDNEIAVRAEGDAIKLQLD